MSTRATYQFKDEFNTFTVYKHCDGYPEGGLQWIANTIPKAWKLPRFEAAEFGAAFIAANKEHEGDVYLTTAPEDHGDTEYNYIVECKDGRIFVTIQSYNTEHNTFGYLTDLFKKYVETLYINKSILNLIK